MGFFLSAIARQAAQREHRVLMRCSQALGDFLVPGCCFAVFVC